MKKVKSNSFIPALMLATAGLGVGNLTANLGQEEAPVLATAPTTTTVRVYEQELHHGADSSLRKGLGLGDATNADVLKICTDSKALRATNAKQLTEIARLRKLNKKALVALKKSQKAPARRPNAVKTYYGE
jgi:hypothetical protein